MVSYLVNFFHCNGSKTLGKLVSSNNFMFKATTILCFKQQPFFKVPMSTIQSSNPSNGALAEDCINNNLNTTSNKTNANQEKIQIILVACGSFNPVTNMHLRMFELARDYFHKKHSDKYDVASGYLSPVSDGYGKTGLENGFHRQKMCELAVSSSSWIKVLDWELKQKDWTPTVQVLEHYESMLCKNSNANTKLMLLCGADFLQTFLVEGLWLKSNIKKIIEHHGLVVVTRPTYDPSEVIHQSDFLFSLKENIHIVQEWVINDVSSTKIRQAVRSKQSIKYLIPDPVVEYIYKHSLYSAEPSASQELAPFKRFRN